MRVHVSSRLPANAFGLGYEAEYNGRACVVQTVVEDFARRFSLPAKMCTAFQVGKKLDGNELLLQVLGHREVLVLSIHFTPSLALYIWQSFRKGLWQPVKEYADVEDVWVAAAEVCGTQGFIARSIAGSTAFLPAVLAVEPLQTFEVDRLLLELYSSNPSNSLVLPQVQPLVRTLLLVAQLLATVAAEHNDILCVIAPINSTAGWDQLRSAVVSRMNKLTDNSCCTPVLLPGPTTSQDCAGAPQPLLKPSKCVTALRGAVLVSKLATLTFNVKADLLGHAEPPGMPVAVQSLWHVMSSLAVRSLNCLYDSESDESESEAQSDETSICSWRPNCEEHILCVHLCEHIVATLRPAVKEPEAGFQTAACLQLLDAMLDMACQKMRPQLLTYEVNRLGVLPLVVACLDKRPHAYIALRILMRLASSTDPDSHHMDLLARLQGVRRLSNVFFIEEQASKGPAGSRTSPAFSHRPAKSAAVSAEESLQQLDGNVYNTRDAVNMVSSLLDLHPLSQRPPAEVTLLDTHGNPADDCATAMNGCSNKQQCTMANASTHAQASRQPAKWPTPTPSEWKDIELVASRGCASLTWALSLSDGLSDDVDKLTRDLCQLIQRLVIGHLSDLDLDMQKLFKAGLQPVLAALHKGHAEYSGLAVAMLSRLALDSTLISQSQLTDTSQLLSVFCKASTPPPEEAEGEGPSDVLRAAARVLHFVVSGEKGLQAVNGLENTFMSAFEHAMSAFSDNLPDRMLLCACLGAFEHGDVITRKEKTDDAIFTTLEQVMQVPTPWDEELCHATAIMLNRCCASSLLQSPSLSLRCEAMQSLLVQLLQQLQGFKTTESRRLQRWLITGCCRCLRALYMPSGATNCSAVVPAISDWLVVIEEADTTWEPTTPKRDPMPLIPGLSIINLTMEMMLHSFVCALTAYLDSPSKWHELAQRGLEHLLTPLCTSMWLASKQPAVQQSQGGAAMQLQYFNTLASASKHQALDPGFALKSESDDAIARVDEQPQSQEALAAKLRLHALWRRVACAAVVLLASRCYEARWLHFKHKNSRLEMLKLRQKKDPVERAGSLARLQVVSSELLLELRRAQQQIVRVLPALLHMEQEPAWPHLMAGHQPQDWPGSEPPPDRHQDLVYLAAENALSDETAQTIHSFYSFMLGNPSVAAAADSLVADEASEAAKAAAKKAKKQKAKARKQQARSDATSASPPPVPPLPASDPSPIGASTGGSLQRQQDVEPEAALQLSSTLDGTGHGVPPEQDTAGLHAQLHSVTVHDSAKHTLPLHAALDEQESTPAAAAAQAPEGNAAAVDASQGDDATFLDQLFCCPITKVVMVNPVIAADGHTYERTAIQHWLQGSCLSPVTGGKLPHTRLVPNMLVKSALAQHAQAS